MYGRNSAGPDAAITEVEARKVWKLWRAAKFAARGPAPILKLCRILTDAGRSDRPLEARRGDTLCVTVNSDCRNTASN